MDLSVVLISILWGGIALVILKKVQEYKKKQLDEKLEKTEIFRKLKQYRFTQKIINEFRKHHPKLNLDQVKLVENGLKDFFALVILNPKKKIAMTSRVVDDLWHAFLEDKDEYDLFCKNVLKRDVAHVEDTKASKGFPRNQPIRSVNREVAYTYKLANSSQNNSYYQFALSGGVLSLFYLDSLLNLDSGYFYDNQSFNLLEKYTPSRNTSSGSDSGSSTSSCSSCGSVSAGSDCGGGDGGYGCSCGSCGSGCGGGCGGD